MSTKQSNWPFSPRQIYERVGSHYDYFHKTVGWIKVSGTDDLQKKHVPYSNLQELNDVQGLGGLLHYHSMTAQVINRNLVNYIIGKGHTYTIKPRPGRTASEDQVTRYQQDIERFMEAVTWPVMQEDFYSRLFRSGDTLQYCEPYDGVLDVQWMEPHDLKPPEGKKNEIAKYGIEYETVKGIERPTRPKTYYVGASNEKAKPISVRNMHHCKRGVDMNDPRGIPLLWMTYCECREIDELHLALTQVMLSAAENSVVHEFPAGTTAPAKVQQVANALDQHNAERAENGHEHDAGRITQADGFVVKNYGAEVATEKWIEAILAKERRIGMVASLPEFAITGDAETGNRSSMLSVEGPLLRAIDREAKKGSSCEKKLMYKAIAAANDKFTDDTWMRELVDTFQIVPHIPLPSTESLAERSQRLREDFAAGLIDFDGYCRLMDRDPEDILTGIEKHQQRMAEITGRVAPLAHESGSLEVYLAMAAELQNQGGNPWPYLEQMGVDPVAQADLIKASGINAASAA